MIRLILYHFPLKILMTVCMTDLYVTLSVKNCSPKKGNEISFMRVFRNPLWQKWGPRISSVYFFLAQGHTQQRF